MLGPKGRTSVQMGEIGEFDNNIKVKDNLLWWWYRFSERWVAGDNGWTGGAEHIGEAIISFIYSLARSDVDCRIAHLDPYNDN